MSKPAAVRGTLFAAVLAAFCSLACAAPPARAADAPPLVIAGTGDSEELLRILAARYMREFPGTRIEVPDSIGTSGGIKAVLAGKAELARTARPLRDEEKAQGLAEIVFARSPLVFAVNPSVTGVESLTKEQVLDVFSGKTADWAALGAPAGPIRKVCRETPETGRVVLNAAIDGFEALDCREQAVAYSTPEAVAMTANNPGAIGYFAKSAMTGTRLRALALSGVAPTPENVNRGTYGLFIPFALVYKPPLSPAAADFIKALALPDARTAMANYGCLPLPVSLPSP
ncbi:substrate-binding domain-containing protein [Solidesulfovibrio sp.]|jgi:phosphate transport system substrate-binding protein|uniref:substrate-binding domain-containing protein n=1 Tax=Solidesulfovibrio sp. TaxID=2910990 RepID=UPI002B206A92|nr:substrate-binding domain-containing protein [Solidesulfovibrio sp.]MEA5089025.1 substrate-binding domain-containing protein [Solidesulfovibrio sp.]